MASARTIDTLKGIITDNNKYWSYNQNNGLLFI